MEGISGEFHRLEHPSSVCWVKLTLHRQIVKVSSFRNPSAFVCDYNDVGYPFFALAAPWQGFENRAISALKLTILPGVKESPVSILVVLAFQSQSSDLELLVDRANKTINGFRLNSEEVVFSDYQTLSIEDLIRINMLHQAMSKALKLTEISSLQNQFKSLINQCDIPIDCSSTIVRSGEHICWERLLREDWVESNDFNPEYDLDPSTEGTFNFYPELKCSLLENVSLRKVF